MVKAKTEAKPTKEGKYVPRFKEKYIKEIIPSLMKELTLSNPMQVPRLEKIVINTGIGEGAQNPKAIDAAAQDLALITGQKPLVTKAKKSIAGFKIRAGATIGCKVTLRGPRMYEFLDRLLSAALPRIRDFRGLSPRSFDGRGNFTFGVDEQLIFPEIDYDKVEKVRGMDITIVTTAKNDEMGLSLLKKIGFPFKEK
ncbi:MAG: 50S ribosomal protein L5 [Candidatus Subteraquimicrobiales bacterium]|nr:50S ribosomal protein L5 [Candidatus Subteraquimicrobiales bacterium]